MKLIDAPSPNFDDRKLPVDTVILHYTGMETGAEALKRLQDPDANVSAHYLVEENGDVYKLVEEDKRAWHAGVSYWKGDIEMNGRSIGVEIVNPGHQFGYRDFPDAQIASVVALLKEICARHKIDPARVIGHSDVAPRRKEDPGEKFPWKKLSDEGLALAPFEGDPKAGEAVTFEAALEALSEIGYDANLGDYAAGVLAFQRRFCPQSLGQGLDPLTRAALVSVKEKL